MWENGRTSDCCLSRCFQLPVWRPSRISRQSTLIRSSICQCRLLSHKHQMNSLKFIWLISSRTLVISEADPKMKGNEKTKMRAYPQVHHDRLVLRGSPSRDESLLNFCERISFENGYESPFWLLDKPSGSIDEFFEDRNIKRIAYVSGCSHEDLVMRSYKTYNADGVSVHFFDKIIYGEYIKYESPKICTICLMVGLTLCAAWDISLWVACPIHEVGLIERCPSCGVRLTCLRKEPCRCVCGFDLRCCVGGAADISEIYCAQHLAALIDWHVEEFIRPEFSISIMRLDLNGFLRLVTELMYVPVRQSRSSGEVYFEFIPLFRSYNLGIMFIAPILFGWPSVFYAHILDINDFIIQRRGSSQFFMSISYMEKMRGLSILVDGSDYEWRKRFPTYMSGDWLAELEERCERNDQR